LAVKNYFKSLCILLELAGRLVATSTLALLGCLVLIAVCPILAVVFHADDLEQMLDV
jgi:hypothetical protein